MNLVLLALGVLLLLAAMAYLALNADHPLRSLEYQAVSTALGIAGAMIAWGMMG